MKVNNPFEDKISTQGNRIPENIRLASIAVVDTLDIAIAAAKALFEDDYKPELALAVYDRIVNQLKEQTIDTPID